MDSDGPESEESEETFGELYDKLTEDDRRKAFFLLFGIVEFYANPDTWVAVSLLPDPPCGDIIRDFRLAPDGSHRPGGRARLSMYWLVSLFRRVGSKQPKDKG